VILVYVHGGSARKVVAQVPVEEVRVDVASDFGLRLSFAIFVCDSVCWERERECRDNGRESWVDEGERRVFSLEY
jgi:hypothetical protein